jgi:hypothetical protein
MFPRSVISLVLWWEIFYTMGHFSRRELDDFFQNYFFIIWEGSPKKAHHYFGPHRTFGIHAVSANRDMYSFNRGEITQSLTKFKYLYKSHCKSCQIWWVLFNVVSFWSPEQFVGFAVAFLKTLFTKINWICFLDIPPASSHPNHANNFLSDTKKMEI